MKKNNNILRVRKLSIHSDSSKIELIDKKYLITAYMALAE